MLTMQRDDMAIAHRVKQLREAAGLTQQQLAVKAGLATTQISKVEQGQTRDPRWFTVVAIARALGVPLDQLLDQPDNPAEPS